MKIMIALVFAMSGCLESINEDKITIDTIPGNNNNVFVGDGDGTLVVFRVGDGFPFLTGFDHGYDGRTLDVETTYDSAVFTVTSEDGSSRPRNQLLVDPTPGKTYRSLRAQERLRLRYDATLGLWVEY